VHIITKFLVILASVLAVLLAGLTIAYTANADRVVSENKSMREQVAAAQAAQARAEASAGADKTAQSDQLKALQDQLQAAQSNERSALANATRLEQQVKELRLEQQSYQNRIDEFLALSQQDISLREAQQQEIRDLRSEVNAQARRIIDLIDRNSDLVSQLENSQNTVRALTEQIELQRRGGAGGTDSIAALPDTFRARVVGVVTDDDGAVFVEINAGRSDRIAEGMELTVTRDGGWVAKIEIERVELNSAVGRVTLTGSRGQVQDDDMIIPGDR
jgi:uncharacterized protein YhaN